MRSTPRRHRPSLSGITIASVLGASLLAPLAAAPAYAEEGDDASDVAYASFDTLPRASAPLSPGTVALSLPVTASSEFGYSNRHMQTVADPGSGAVALQATNADGTLDSSVDLSGLLDEVHGGFPFNDWDAGNVLKAYVWGAKDGAGVLVRVVSPEKRTLTGAAAEAVSTDLIEPTRVVAFGEAGSGLLVVQQEDDGAYVAQRTDYAATGAVGAEFVLDLPDAEERSFAIDSSYSNIVSSRDGAVDVISRYAPETVYTVESEGLGVADVIDLSGTTAAVADADGDLALFELDFSATHKLVGTARVDGGVRSLAVASNLSELFAVPEDGHSVQRFSTSDLAALDPIALGDLTVLDGSLESLSRDRGGRFLAAIGGSVYRYTTDLQQAASIFVYDGTQSVNVSNPATRGANMSWSFAASGTGSMSRAWEYSLDGGAHWAERGASWDTAVADRGDQAIEPAALPEPLDGVAPALRSEVDPSKLHAASSYSAYESSVAVADYAYDGLWRVRVTNPLASVASTPFSLTIADEAESLAPKLTRHPVSATVAQSKTVTLEAAATGTPEPSVAWERSLDGGETWAAIANQTSATLTVAGRLHEDGARYRAVFTNDAGTATTQPAVVRVTGADAPAIGAAPEGAVVASGAELAYDVSQYAHEWLRAAWGENVSVADPTGFSFSSGSGWIEPAGGATQVVWSGAAIFQPYGGMNGLHVTIANPYLAVAADGRGSLTADVAWNNGGGMYGTGDASESDGFKRVVLATFADSEVSIAADGTAAFAGTPEWEGRTYVKPGLADSTVYPSSWPASLVDWIDEGSRGWFLATGNSRDPEKAPLPVAASFAVTVDPASGEGEPVDPVEPLDAAPVVSERPKSTSVTVGETATLSAAATGRPTPTVRWQRQTDGAWTDVEGATATTVELSGLDVGAHRYRAVFANRAGETASAAATVTVKALPVVSSAAPEIEGTAKVGQKVTVAPGDWQEGASLSYQWLLDGEAISGATAAGYTPTAAQAGKKLSVTVTGELDGHTSASETSETSTVAKGTLASATPKVTGTVKMGSTLKAAAGSWTKGTALTYQWLRDGKAIAKATSASYTLVAADAGKRISVKVTGALSGYTTAAKSSAATKAVAKGTLTTKTPTISGSLKVGSTVTAKPGTWTSGTKLTYQWLRDGKAISGATASTYKLRSADAGHKVSVKVTGTKTGYTTATKSSAVKSVTKR
ncbi:hypothetical protein [Microbacterium marinilacus]|uniref:Ig-like domain-containing protein n=1 Tax=Microbacterium marinilacus TaxID=415209 RepID=A0ABP7BX99_9MICO